MDQRKFLTNQNFNDFSIPNKSLKNEREDGTKKHITPIHLLRTSLLYQTREFFNNSTLHGVRYIAETGRPFGERFMWFCFTAIGFISALVIIVSLWEKFQTNPTITGLDMDVHSQHLIFPTVVLCPFDSFNSNRSNDLVYTNLGVDNEDSANVYEAFFKHLPKFNFDNMDSVYEESKSLAGNEESRKMINTKTLRSLAFQISLFCNETFEICKYRDEEIECCDHFYSIYTEHGFCYAFNPRYIDSIEAETHNKKFHDLFETDKKWSLLFKPRVESKIFVHSHYENFGWDFRPHTTWEPEIAVELLISMKQTFTTEDAKQLSIGQRKCIFPDEVKLDIYDEEYTFTSCMKECRLKKSMKLCHCIAPFYRPIASMPYCKVEDLGCLAKYAANITEVRDCNKCELSCANTVYDIEKLSKSTTDAAEGNEDFVNIEYLTWPIIRYKREVLFGWVDLLVSFGGIAGLFLGFSLLSGVEIIYYFTLRACCMFYKNRDELYEIETKKLLEPQKEINLSLKLIKQPSESKPKVTKILVSESSPSEKDLKKSSNEGVLLGDMYRYDQLLSKRFNRISIKLDAARAFKQTINKSNQLVTSYDFDQSKGPYYIP